MLKSAFFFFQIRAARAEKTVLAALEMSSGMYVYV